MSNIKSGIYEINLRGRRYGLLFSLNVLDAVQDKYGTIDQLAEIFNPENNKDWLKDTKWLLALLVNEGANLEEFLGVENPVGHITEQELGLLVDLQNFREVQNAIFAAFARGTKDDQAVALTDEETETEDDEGNGQGAQVE